jgi:hypothetical protein
MWFLNKAEITVALTQLATLFKFSTDTMLLLVVVVMAVLMLSLLFSIVDRRDRKLGEIF